MVKEQIDILTGKRAQCLYRMLTDQQVMVKKTAF